MKIGKNPIILLQNLCLVINLNVLDQKESLVNNVKINLNENLKKIIRIQVNYYIPYVLVFLNFLAVGENHKIETT